jgi:hypothetical protein
LDEADHIRTWATTSSAVAIYSHAHSTLGFADGKLTFSDPTCPQTSDDGTIVTISGGCTDASDTEFVGSATVVRSATGDRTLTFDEFGSFNDPSFGATKSGTFVFRRLGPTTHEFDADFVHRGGMTTTFRYSGSIEGDHDIATVWNGSGEVERDGLLAPTGRISATTTDQVVDDAVCSGQPVSGQTEIDDGQKSAVITYDGETDCDEEQAARLHVDGQDRGLITGISCALDPRHLKNDGAGAILFAAFFSVGVASRARRRRAGARSTSGGPSTAR